MRAGVIGLGFVGGAMYKSFMEKGVDVIGYDKFNGKGNVESLDEVLDANFLFLALPTLFDKELMQYNKDAINETCDFLSAHDYKGVIVIKSTVEPETTNNLGRKFDNLKFVHNPEFLTARTAFEDFHNQSHIVLGRTSSVTDNDMDELSAFYNKYYPDAEITLSTALESESMKIFVNSYYSVKVQFFNELYLLCQDNGCDYERVKGMMLKNGWINPMHTVVPGPDGSLSYGGACFPKDTNALNQYMKTRNTPNAVLDACIKERNGMRNEEFF